MRWRIASINDLPIKDSERKYHWPLGRRPMTIRPSAAWAFRRINKGLRQHQCRANEQVRQTQEGGDDLGVSVQRPV
jgi:hypothetical protein